MDTKSYPEEYFYSAVIVYIAHYLTLMISILLILILPLYFHVLFTKSSSLGMFKWFILNHSIWSIIFTLEVLISKPVFLFPAISGYVSDIFNEDSALIMFVIVLVTSVFEMGGSIMTLIYRYAVIFKHKTGFLSSPKALVIYVLCQITIIFSCTALGVVFMINRSRCKYSSKIRVSEFLYGKRTNIFILWRDTR